MNTKITTKKEYDYVGKFKVAGLVSLALVLGTFAATFVLLSLASLKPAAHVVVNGLLASAADVMPPVALNDPPPAPV